MTDDKALLHGDRLQGLHPCVQPHADLAVWRFAASLLSQPRFDEAVLAYCRSMTAAQRRNWPSNKLFAQKLRHITCYTLVALHARHLAGEGPPPTLKSLQAMVPSSPRQVSGLIAGLRAGGYVRAHANARDLRTLRLHPSDLLIEEVGRSPLAFLEAAACLDGINPDLTARLRTDMAMLARCLSSAQRGYAQADVYFTPFREVCDFSEHDSGYLVLCAVMGAHAAARSAGAWDLPLTYNLMAARLQVSRQHIGNLLKGAEDRGLFVIEGGRVEGMHADLAWQFRTWCAGQIALYGIHAAESVGS